MQMFLFLVKEQTDRGWSDHICEKYSTKKQLI